MKVVPTAISDVLVLEPNVFEDERGFFFESYNECRFAEITGQCHIRFVQDNHSHSTRHVLRGLHYQIRQPQGKLVRVISGEVFDVSVDIRRSSPTFGRWVGNRLSAENRRQVWIPKGFAHGFLVLGNSAEVIYKTTDYWAPDYERCILWNDPTIGVQWPLNADPLLSHMDQQGRLLTDAEVFA